MFVFLIHFENVHEKDTWTQKERKDSN